jgi:hypothetical protein
MKKSTIAKHYLIPISIIASAIIFISSTFGSNLTNATSVSITPTKTPTTTSVLATVPPTEAPTTTTTTLLPPHWSPPTLPADVPCQEWTQTALDAGWHWELLPEILTIAHRESRCQNIIEGHPKWNGHDRGPLQINQVWLDEIEDKYGHWEYVNDPYHNFAWAWEMYIWFDANRGCGFDPWYKTYSCK